MQLPELLRESIEDKVLHQSIHKISEASFICLKKYQQWPLQRGVCSDGHRAPGIYSI
jgi:hypothetical protein